MCGLVGAVVPNEFASCDILAEYAKPAFPGEDALFSEPSEEPAEGLPSADVLSSEDNSIPPVPLSNHMGFTFGNFSNMASTWLRVGRVLPVKMLLSEAVPIPVKEAKVCWFMCCASISWRILSFIYSNVFSFFVIV